MSECNDWESRTNSTSCGSASELDYFPLRWEGVGLEGRDKEIEKIQEAIDRVRVEGGRAEALLVHGYSGTGKTVLVRRVLQEQKNLMPVFGKYDQVEGAQRPFSAIDNIASELCQIVLAESFESQATIHKIQAALSDDELRVLKAVVPDIENVFPAKLRSRKSETMVGESALIRFMNIFRRFVQAIASADVPIVLFLERSEEPAWI